MLKPDEVQWQYQFPHLEVTQEFVTIKKKKKKKTQEFTTDIRALLLQTGNALLVYLEEG